MQGSFLAFNSSSASFKASVSPSISTSTGALFLRSSALVYVLWLCCLRDLRGSRSQNTRPFVLCQEGCCSTFIVRNPLAKPWIGRAIVSQYDCAPGSGVLLIEVEIRFVVFFEWFFCFRHFFIIVWLWLVILDSGCVSGYSKYMGLRYADPTSSP